MSLKNYLFLVGVALLLVGCFNQEAVEPDRDDNNLPEQAEEEPIVEEGNDDSTEKTKDTEQEEQKLSPEEAAEIIVTSLKKEDMNKLADMTHQTKGVLFSPYGYIDEESATVFSNEEVRELLDDSTVHHWGHYDGTGEPIELTFSDYYKRFVYDEDYALAPERSINERLGHGNTLDNSKEVFPNSTVIEYYFPGFDPQYEGMDWRSLRLVLIEENDGWRLVGIIHDEWTS